MSAYLVDKCAANARVRSNGVFDAYRPGRKRSELRKYKATLTFSLTSEDHAAMMALAVRRNQSVSHMLRHMLKKEFLS